MPDYEKTYEFFERAGYTDHLKRDPPAWVMELNHIKNWKARGTDPQTKTWRRNTAQPEVEYPIKLVTAIKRVMTSKGEVLLSNQRWVCRTSLQNNLTINVDNVEMYDEPIFSTAHRTNPKDANDIITETTGVDTWVRNYTLKNTPENMQALIDMADPNQPPSLSVADFRMTGSNPREVSSFEDLKDKPFNELLSPPILNQQQPSPSVAPPGTARVTRPR